MSMGIKLSAKYEIVVAYNNIIYIVLFVIQVKYSPRFREGFGLTDGEVMERLWSKVRRYSRMTKEMRPSHRIDVLTDVFLHLGREANYKLGIVIWLGLIPSWHLCVCRACYICM